MKEITGKSEESVSAKTLVIIDGDLSSERIEKLINLGREEERLDYKEKIDFSSKASTTRGKIDLMCDIVSMANTDGGYIIFGIKDNKDGSFSRIGIDDEHLRQLTQENIQDMVGSYIDASLKLLAKPVQLKEYNFLGVCVSKSRLPVPFRRDGQYCNPRGSNEVKFRSGELFVRHGAKSERANYENWVQVAEKIREDERGKALPVMQGEQVVVDRLDTIINLLKGDSSSISTLSIAESAEEVLEDRIEQLLSLKNQALIRRLIKKEFNNIYKFLEREKKTESYEELVENLDRTYINFLTKLNTIWKVAIDDDNLEMGKTLIESAYRLYVKIYPISYKFETNKIDSLWLQSKIVLIICSLGAFSVLQDKPEFSKLLLNRRNTFEDNWKNRTWFRYILTMLSRKHMLEKKGLCVLTFDFVEENPYIIDMFEGEEKLKNSLSQFDFLQCADAFIRSNKRIDCYPSFGIFYKKRVEPMVEKIIDTHQYGTWISKIETKLCAEVIDQLDYYSEREFGFYYDWTYKYWESPKIVEFMKRIPYVQSS